jgi:hypothetical protein
MEFIQSKLLCFWTLQELALWIISIYILPWHMLGHAIKSVTCFDLQFSRGKIGHFLENGGIWMINHHIFKVFYNTICLAYIPETVMNFEDDYVNKPEKYKTKLYCYHSVIKINWNQSFVVLQKYGRM